MLELGLDSTDGTGATLAWPLVKQRSRACSPRLADGEDPGSEPARGHEMTA
jgi:nicotinate-nucleotide--dimethylbenzimidazole phosphoribosyltransferase